MSGLTEQQIAELRAPLTRNHVKEREQSGRKVSYIEGWHAIAEANRIFGFDGWDRETVECRLVTEREAKIGQRQDDGWRVGYVAKVRVTVFGDGLSRIVREGTGYGSGIDRDLGAAHESAIKEAETDAMKRALMTFGNPFGLALYDKLQADVEPAAGHSRARAAARQIPDSRAGPPHNLNQAALPPNPEESPEVAEGRERIRTMIHKIDKAIKGAPTRDALDLVMEDGKDQLVEIERAGTRGMEAAAALRHKYALRIEQIEGQAAA